ncbi:hypothetical protein [Acidipila rosea]|uniref:Uncharacterized protein n=1 Tax=Acidipila rosea TaxID=768535 RepID=A0A4R1L6I5_9BACT|nr:hypothetical protein [Acidipila rosea]TCK72807.1 hypothetical protein C7378_2397 [Acidipila rosea]
MQRDQTLRHAVRLLVLALAGALVLPVAYGDSCTMQSQIPSAQREELSRVARTLVGEVQSGDLQGLRNNTLASVAANFDGIAHSAEALKPLIQQAGITVDQLFAFEATQAPQGTLGSQFFCSPVNSSMTVVLNFSTLPPGKYVLAILHATGVPKPQQISLILAESPEKQWKLAGFFTKSLMLAGQNGLWYWTHAREYAQQKLEWPAWFYYQIAEFLVDPVDFLSSPNMEKLKHEADEIRPKDLPDDKPVMLQMNGTSFEVTKVDASAELGPLDFVVHYTPSDAQSAQLRDPVAARKQAIDVMTGLLAQHPGLRQAFHGVWVYADAKDVTVFALELPMDQIPGGAQTSAPSSAPSGR